MCSKFHALLALTASSWCVLQNQHNVKITNLDSSILAGRKSTYCLQTDIKTFNKNVFSPAWVDFCFVERPKGGQTLVPLLSTFLNTHAQLGARGELFVLLYSVKIGSSDALKNLLTQRNIRDHFLPSYWEFMSPSAYCRVCKHWDI